MTMRWALLVAVVACGGSKGPRAPSEACTCEELRRPPVPPPDEATRAWWQRTHDGVAAAVHEAGLLFPAGECTATIDADLSRVLAAHATAIQDYHALNAVTCYGFANWQAAAPPAFPGVVRDVDFTRGLRGCIHLSPELKAQVLSLMITPWCTIVE